MRARPPLLIAAAVLSLLTLAPAVAQAATYSVWACANGAGQPLAASDWSANTTGPNAIATTTCGSASSGGVAGNLQAIAGAGPGQGDTSIGASWNVAAVAATKITGLDVWWSNQAAVEAPGRVQIYAGQTSIYQRDSGTFGSAALPYDDANHQSFTGLNDDSVALAAWCVFSCATPAHAVTALFQAYRVKLTVSDTVAPTGDVSGLTDGMTIGAPTPVFARAADAGGGVRDIQLVIDGAVVDTRQTGGQCVDVDPTTGDDRDYALMHPCVAQLPAAGLPPAQFTISPAMLGAGGAHTIAIVAHDAAGNAGTLASRQVLVAPALQDGPAAPGFYDSSRDLFFNPDADTTGPARPNGTNAGPATISLTFTMLRRVGHAKKRHLSVRLSDRRTVSYAAGARMTGRVTTPTGDAIAGARVYLAQSEAGGLWTLNQTPLTTAADGAVSIRLPGRAPSRRVRLVYFPSSDSNTSMRSPVRLLRVKAPVALAVTHRVVHRGARVNITAHVLAGIRPGATVLGALQVLRGGHWRTFRQLHFSARGGGVSHTALRLQTPAAYRLRLRVSAQPGLQYTIGVSRAQVVHVR